VIIVTVLILVLVLGIATAAVSQAIQVSSKANRDPLVKAALQAADAGVQTAIFRLNSLAQYLTNTTTTTPCVEATVDANANLTGLVLEAALTTGPSWCPASPAQRIGNGETFSYQMSPILTVRGNPADPDGLHYTLDRRIVATGTATGPRGTLTRRVVQTVTAPQPSLLFYDYALLGQSAVTVSGSAQVGSATTPAPIRSNHNATVQLSSGGIQCGNVVYGPPGSGGSFTGAATGCPSGQTVSAAPGAFPLPTLTAPTSNNNTALANACAALTVGSCTFSSGNLTLSGSPATTLTIPAGNYELCSITVSGASTLVIGDTAASPVVIYIDPPGTNGCTPPSSGAVSIAGNAKLTATTGVSPSAFQLQVAGLSGSPSAASTAVNVSGSSSLQTPMTLVAPYSNVTIGGSTSLLGGVLGDAVTVSGNAVLTPFGQLSLPSTGTPLYRKGTYTECTPSPPPSGSPPDQGC
jgi:hypothetical protein